MGAPIDTLRAPAHPCAALRGLYIGQWPIYRSMVPEVVQLSPFPIYSPDSRCMILIVPSLKRLVFLQICHWNRHQGLCTAKNITYIVFEDSPQIHRRCDGLQ